MKRIIHILSVFFALIVLTNHAFALIPQTPIAFYVRIKYDDGEKDIIEVVPEAYETVLPSGAQIYITEFNKENLDTTILFFPPDSAVGYEMLLKVNENKMLDIEGLQGAICLKRNKRASAAILW